MPSSVVVAVRKAVTDGLRDHMHGLPGLNGTVNGAEDVVVTYAYDRTVEAAERVFTRSASADTPPAAMRPGRNFKNEAGQFFLVVLVACVGGSPDEADDRAIAIGEVVEEWLGDRKNNELGVDGLTTLTVRGWELDNLSNDHGSMSELTYRVEWTARIT